MFASSVTTTPVTGDIPDLVFGAIGGDTYRNDVSFIATLRMLLHNRMKEGEELHFRVRASSYRFNDIEGASLDAIIGAFIGNPGGFSSGTFMVHYLEGATETDRKKIVDLIGSKFVENYPGWARMDEITNLFRKSFGIYCFYNTEERKTILFLERMSMKIWHYIQCAVFGYFPWYFERKPGSVAPEEMALITSLREETSEKYLECLAKFAEQFDFRAMHIKKLLDGYEKTYLRSEMESCEQNQRNMMESISDWQEQINDYSRRLYDLQIRMSGLITKLSEDTKDSEVMDYFVANKRLVLENVVGTELRFGVKDYLEYFDPEAAKTYIRNKSSFFYTNKPMGYALSNSDIEELLKLLFVDQKLRIRFCAFYNIDLRGSVSAISHHTFSAEYDNFMPNPHIQSFHCLGGYDREIRKCLGKGDVVGGIEQCIASAKSLNFHDSPVMREFMGYFYSTRTKPFIELPDGTMVGPIDAVKWIKEEKAKAAAKKAAEDAAQKAEEQAAASGAVEDAVKPVRKRRTKKAAAASGVAPAAETTADAGAAAQTAADEMAEEIAQAAEAAVHGQEEVDG